mmetsp:Transcript_11795/g.15401  ORF Transcript_11795/g.15401 Transcript_11795/m.15401 type:complete len:346 (+) Transcript_11795:113-1150(+)|eukprot:CAMPEP_0117753186 /NCGR_PEP_ID=MMETSP0947-20121206/12068_1 /TAXON_ID=44440 /ORGANISM="Chattonella subsalsa, Strain CCMP2191" /LENGTH=345 /DNA_ID=CAMNT_0005572005 /DNA_START=80 /DNA_END=1117 /DNA_ORIENTATION=-
MDSSDDEFKAELDSQKEASEEFQCFSDDEDSEVDGGDLENEEFDIFDAEKNNLDTMKEDEDVPKSVKASPKHNLPIPVAKKAANAIQENSKILKKEEKPPPKKTAKTEKKASAPSKAKSSKAEKKAANKKPAAPKDPKNVILQYLNQTNRPYSLINIYDNLHRSIPKNLAQKMLDELFEAGDIRMKEYGKAKIYFADQDKLSSSDISPESLANLDQQAKELKAHLAELTSQLNSLTSQAQTLASELPDEELRASLAEKIARNEEKENRIKEITGSSVAASPGRKRKICQNFNKYRDLWVKRKRTANDFLGSLADGLEKKLCDVEEMIGVETDKEMGCKVPDKISL